MSRHTVFFNSIVFLPQEKYNVKRKDFSTVQANDVNYFKSVLGEDRVLTEEDDVLSFNIDWIRNCRGCILRTLIEGCLMNYMIINVDNIYFI